MSKLPGSHGLDPFAKSPRTPGSLAVNDAADPDTPHFSAGDTAGPLGTNFDWADPDHLHAIRQVLLASAGGPLPASDAAPDEYAPDLGTNPATVKMYDDYFKGPKGALLKTRIEAAARQVDINPGLLASTLFAEDKVKSYTKETGEVDGVDIGVDDYKTRSADIKRRVPAAKSLEPTRYGPYTNEKHRVIPDVPYFKATDAVLAMAAYLKYAELKVRDECAAVGGSFDRLPVEHRFALTRFAVNAGPGAMKRQVQELILGAKYYRGKLIPPILQYKPWKLKAGLEQFNAVVGVRRAATAHTAQAIHLSQKIFGKNPLSGSEDSILFVR